jgi:hypothetical protein
MLMLLIHAVQLIVPVDAAVEAPGGTRHSLALPNHLAIHEEW